MQYVSNPSSWCTTSGGLHTHSTKPSDSSGQEVTMHVPGRGALPYAVKHAKTGYPDSATWAWGLAWWEVPIPHKHKGNSGSKHRNFQCSLEHHDNRGVIHATKPSTWVLLALLYHPPDVPGITLLVPPVFTPLNYKATFPYMCAQESQGLEKSTATWLWGLDNVQPSINCPIILPIHNPAQQPHCTCSAGQGRIVITIHITASLSATYWSSIQESGLQHNRQPTWNK